jgi:mitochondrial fission protein ELM1
LRARGVSQPFEDHLSGDPYPPLDETSRAARCVLERYRQKYG